METKNKKARAKGRSRLGIKAPSEAQIGRSFYKWWNYAYKGLGVPYPGLLFHIPNEGAGGNPIRGAILKGQGVVKGIPDYFLAVPSNGFNGLFIELKKQTGKASKEQDAIIVELVCQGYAASVCYSFDEAVKLVESYLNQKSK